MLDITETDNLEIEIRDDGTVVWISLDGITRMRVCRIKNLHINDHRV